MYHASRVTSSAQISKFRNCYFLRISVFTIYCCCPSHPTYILLRQGKTSTNGVPTPTPRPPLPVLDLCTPFSIVAPKCISPNDQISLGSSPVLLPSPRHATHAVHHMHLARAEVYTSERKYHRPIPLPHVSPSSARLTPTPRRTAADVPSRATGLEASAPRGSRTQRRPWTSETRRRRRLGQS